MITDPNLDPSPSPPFLISAFHSLFSPLNHTLLTMKIPESITKERRADIESATAPSTDPNILEPLQFLLAARRGVRADPTFANTHIPDEKVLLYAGESGVKAVNNDSIITRLLFNIGYIGKP